MPNDPAGSDHSHPVGPGSAPRASGAAPDPNAPKDLKVKIAEQKLLIEWKDGRTSEFPLAQLRKHCPCASCRGEREKTEDNPLAILKSDPRDLRVVNARLVGNYAIQLIWSDGHDTGMFDFKLLRSLPGT